MTQISQNLSLQLPAYGEFINTWHIPANFNFEAIDAAFSATGTDDAGTGHIHSGVDGQGPQIDHVNLKSVGTNTHAQLDTHVADSSIHFTERLVSVSDDGATTLFANILDLRFPNARSITQPGSNVVVVDTGGPGVAGPPGIPSHLPTTYAPVAVTDYFNGIDGQPLSASNWFVDSTNGGVELLTNNEAATFSQDLSNGGVASGKTVNRIMCQVPHSEVQRVTLHVCRIGVDDFAEETDVFTIQLALMSSAIAGQNTISRLGLFLKLDVFKQSGQVYMTRTIYAVPAVSSITGDGSVTVLWTDTGAVTDFRHYDGCHEFSVDRRHAFHYVYNNGPVNIGTAANSGAATPFIAPLSASLLAEYALFSQAGGPIPVAPQYGRFGFDIGWHIPSGGIVDTNIRYFTATSTDDESIFYSTIKKPAECSPAPSHPAPIPCCDPADLYPTQTIGSILIASAPSNQPSLGTASYTIIQAIPAGDAIYEYQGFLVKRTGHENDPHEEPIFVCCDAPTNVSAREIVAAQPCTAGARIEITGDCLPGLIDVPVFKPTNPAVALARTIPSGVGTYSTPLPYPVPYLPGSTVRGARVSAAGIWPTTVAVPTSVINPTSWYRDSTTGNIVIEFSVGDGIPYGTTFDVTIQSLINAGNQFTVAQAVTVHAPEPRWLDVRYFTRDTDGTWTEIDPLDGVPESGRLFIVAYGKRLPLPIPRATDGTEATTLWGGFPVDVLDTGTYDLSTRYRILDLTTARTATDLTVHSWSIYKGRFDLTAADLPLVDVPASGNPTAGWPPANILVSNILGETAFLEIEFDPDAAGNEYVLQARELADPSIRPADSPFPVINPTAPIADSVISSPDASVDTSKAITIYGEYFSTAPVVTTTTASQVTNIASVVRVSAQEIQLVCDFESTGTATFRVTNDNGLFDDVSMTVGAASDPSISSVTPSSVVAATRSVELTIQGSDFDLGARLTISPASNPTDYVLDEGSDEITVTVDVPIAPGSTMVFTVTNPGGLASDTFEIDITAPAGPSLTSLAFYATETDYDVTPITTGKEIGKSGFIKVVGTGFRAGSAVTVDVPNYVEIGSAEVISPTELKLSYSIGLSTPVATDATITVTDPDGTSDDTILFTVEDRTPIITTTNVTNKHEGAGVASAPAGSARVLIAGRFFFQDGVDNIDTVAVASGTPYGTVTSHTTLSDNLIEIDELVLSAATAGSEITIEVTSVGGKVASFSFDIEAAVIPEITAFTVHPSGGAPAIVPPTVQPGATSYVIRLYGSNLLTYVTAADLSGPVGGTPADTITASMIEITVPSVDSPVVGDPTISAVLTLAGTATTLVIPLFQVDSSISGSVTVTSVDEYDLIEGTIDGTVVITGTNLAANRVARVDYTANTPANLPLSVSPTTTTKPIQATIIEQSATQITAKLRIADLLSAFGLDFRLKFYAPDGSSVSISNFDIEVDQFPGRAKFAQGSLPSPTTTQSATNTDLLYVIDAATGSESLSVVASNGEDLNPSLTDTGSPSTLQITFDNPTSAGIEVEVQLLDYRGMIIDVHRLTTTS